MTRALARGGLRPVRIAAMLWALMAAQALAHDGFKVVVHPSNLSVSVSRSQLAEMFLKKALRWPDGAPVSPVDRVQGADVREAFSRAVLGRSASEVKSYWLQRIFSGRGLPPSERRTETEVVAFVKANPGAVGYVISAPEEVRVLAVVP